MKYADFKEYAQKEIDKVLENNKVIFAFSKEQLERQREENQEYLNVGHGMFIPSNKSETFLKEWEEATERLNKEALEKCETINIIIYELANHEFCITYDLEETKEALESFNFSEEDYQKAINKYLRECEE